MNSIPNAVMHVEDWGMQKLVDISKTMKTDENMVVRERKTPNFGQIPI